MERKGKLAKISSLISRVSNWPRVLADHAHLSRADYQCELRDGTRLNVRGGTDDRHVIFEVLVEGIYPTPFGAQSTVVDIGAHIGCFSLLAARRGARVFSYEPFPANYKALAGNVELNRASAVQAFPIAVAGETGTRQLFIPDDETHSGRNSLYPRRGTRSVEIQCTTINQIYREHGLTDVALLKVDCQDSEYEVLYSADATVLASTRTIVAECEVMDEGPPEWNVNALAAHLENNGFTARVDGSFLLAAKDPAVLATW